MHISVQLSRYLRAVLAGCVMGAALSLPALAQDPALKSRMTIATGSNGATCALMQDQSARCWGRNTFGELGRPVSQYELRAARPEGLGRNLVAIGGGASFFCALRRNGDVLCWGFNGSGQLGRGDRGDGSHVPTKVEGLAGPAVDISVGTSSVCALLEDGRVQCWGNNISGQLGDGTTTLRTMPVFVEGLRNVVQVSTSSSHTCALRRNGAVFCWGGNWGGQLGDGTTTQSLVPVRVRRLPEAVQISVGTNQSCALGTDGRVRCWGRITYGELGRETATPDANPVPRPVARLRDVVDLTATFGATCAQRADGAVLCWGLNQMGRLGDGDVGDSFSLRRRVAGLGRRDVVQLSVGSTHSCAVTADGRMWCWGWNIRGELGDGTTDPSARPVRVRARDFLVPD